MAHAEEALTGLHAKEHAGEHACEHERCAGGIVCKPLHQHAGIHAGEHEGGAGEVAQAVSQPVGVISIMDEHGGQR